MVRLASIPPANKYSNLPLHRLQIDGNHHNDFPWCKNKRDISQKDRRMLHNALLRIVLE
jgi:hypothetical protein